MYLANNNGVAVLAFLKAGDDVSLERKLVTDQASQSAFAAVEPGTALAVQYSVVAPANVECVLILQVDGVARWACKLEKTSHSSKYTQLHQGTIDTVWRRVDKGLYHLTKMEVAEVHDGLQLKKEAEQCPHKAHGCMSFLVFPQSSKNATTGIDSMTFCHDHHVKNKMCLSGTTANPKPDLFVELVNGIKGGHTDAQRVTQLVSSPLHLENGYRVTWFLRRLAQLEGEKGHKPATTLPLDLMNKVDQSLNERLGLARAEIGDGAAQHLVTTTLRDKPIGQRIKELADRIADQQKLIDKGDERIELLEQELRKEVEARKRRRDWLDQQDRLMRNLMRKRDLM